MFLLYGGQGKWPIIRTKVETLCKRLVSFRAFLVTQEFQKLRKPTLSSIINYSSLSKWYAIYK
jgi:hypothetical protein